MARGRFDRQGRSVHSVVGLARMGRVGREPRKSISMVNDQPCARHAERPSPKFRVPISPQVHFLFVDLGQTLDSAAFFLTRKKPTGGTARCAELHPGVGELARSYPRDTTPVVLRLKGGSVLTAMRSLQVRAHHFFKKLRGANAACGVVPSHRSSRAGP